jgi:hypothetical protein
MLVLHSHDLRPFRSSSRNGNFQSALDGGVRMSTLRLFLALLDIDAIFACLMMLRGSSS